MDEGRWQEIAERVRYSRASLTAGTEAMEDRYTLFREVERLRAALADHEAEVARLRADLDAAQRNQDMLAAVVDYGGQLDQLTDENDRLRAALKECEGAMLPVLGTDPRRVIRTDVDNFPSEYRFTAKEREALIEAVHEARAALSGGASQNADGDITEAVKWVRRDACVEYIHPDGGESPSLQRIGAPCAQCGQMGVDHVRSSGTEEARE